MKTKVTKTEVVDVEISDTEFLRLLSKVLDKVYDFNPSEEYIKDDYICFDVKYHTWSTEKRRPVKEMDLLVRQVFLDLAEYFKNRR